MRIRKLDLIRIGPFTNQTLSFDQGNCSFHLVYGPNEAGKSSSLRALTQWLFGIAGETKCRDHFVHPHKDLRIGGTIENDDGQTLTCIRRHGGQTSLKAEDDRTQIDPTKLAEFLGNITRQQFETQFGIDIHQLVAGGQAIASGGGEIGESLFAAGSGSANIPVIQKRLDADCEDLFKPSSASKKPAINAAINELAAARRTVREISVNSRDWEHRSNELKRLRKKHSDLDAKNLELRSDRDRLTRVRDALPAIGEWRDRQGELSEIGEIVRLRSDFITQRVKVSALLATARSAQKVQADEVDSTDKMLNEIGGPSSILGHGSSIESLFKDLSLYREWLQSYPVACGECDQLQTRAKDALRTLGKRPQLEHADELRISPVARVRIRELAEQRSGLLSAVDHANREQTRLNTQINKHGADLETLSKPEDPSSLKKSIAAAQKLGDIDVIIQNQSDELGGSILTAENSLKRLTLWLGSFEELESLSVPQTETVQLFVSDFEQIDQSTIQLDVELKKLDDEMAFVEESLHALAMGVDVPTEESLNDVRSKRDGKWREIQAFTLEPTDTIDDVAREFAELVLQSDEISDRLRREAQRVSEKARLLDALQRCRIQLEQRTTDRQELLKQRASLVDSWKAVWQPSNIAPLTPTEMNAWLGKQSELVAIAVKIREQRSTLERSRITRDKHIGDLKLYLDDNSDVVDLSPVLDASIERLDQISDLLNKSQKLEAKIDDLKNQRKAAEDAVNEAEQAKNAWQVRWQQAMASLDADEDLSATEAQAVVDTIDQLISDIDAAAKITVQSENLQRQINGFELRVREVARVLGVALDDTSMEQLVADWYDQLKKARNDETSRDYLLSQKEKAESQLQSTTVTIETQLALLQQLCSEANCETSDHLPEVEQRSVQRDQIEQGLAEKSIEIRGFAHGVELETFIAEALDEDPDGLTPRIEQLAEQLDQIDQERKILSETIWADQKDLNQIDGNDKAAMANQNAEEVIARMQTHIEKYVRNKVGSMMLRTAVARYRQLNQGPVLARASALFAHITLGRFAGLDTDSSELHGNVLVGVRITGEGVGDRQFVTVSEMSEGTRDQLFLALRIASLEWHLKSSPPVPFIVDDILLKFDDERSAAALQCLGELSKQTQVIMFTHHRHLIDVAKKAVSGNVLFVHSLDGSLDAELASPG